MATANPVNVRVRLASHADIQSLPAVETSAASRFKSISVLAPVVDGNPTLTTDDFERMLVKDEEEIGSEDHTMTPSLKGLWVAETVRDSRVAIEIVGFIAARSMDQCMFLAEVSVAAAWQGRGIGRRLIEAAVGHARKVAGPAGMTRVTLTTYRDITWNGPWYKKCGFEEVAASMLGPGHMRKLAWDKGDRGLELGGYERICMIMIVKG